MPYGEDVKPYLLPFSPIYKNPRFTEMLMKLAIKKFCFIEYFLSLDYKIVDNISG